MHLSLELISRNKADKSAAVPDPDINMGKLNVLRACEPSALDASTSGSSVHPVSAPRGGGMLQVEIASVFA